MLVMLEDLDLLNKLLICNHNKNYVITLSAVFSHHMQQSKVQQVLINVPSDQSRERNLTSAGGRSDAREVSLCAATSSSLDTSMNSGVCKSHFTTLSS